MSKQTGLGDRLFVDGYDLSGDVGAIGNINGGPAAIEVTGIDKSGIERIGGKRDGAIGFSAFFNKVAGQAHPVLSVLPTADVLLTYFRGTAIGNPGALVQAKQVNYDPTLAADGSLTIDVQALAAANGLEWGDQLTAGIRTDSAPTNGASLNAGGPTAFGLQAVLHVFAFTGTDCTITVQESSNDGGGDPFADVTDGIFTQVTSAPTSERILTGATAAIEQYLRIETVGTFSDIQFAVLLVRNQQERAY